MMFALSLMTAGNKVCTNHWNSEEQMNRKHLSIMRLSNLHWDAVKQLQMVHFECSYHRLCKGTPLTSVFWAWGKPKCWLQKL